MYFNVFKIFLNICIRSIKIVHITTALVECSTVFPVETDMAVSRALFTRWLTLESPAPGRMMEARNRYNKTFQYYTNFS